MSEQDVPEGELGKLAEQAMAEKRSEVGGEEQTRELFDLPTESAEALTEQQGGPRPETHA